MHLKEAGFGFCSLALVMVGNKQRFIWFSVRYIKGTFYLVFILDK